MTTQIPSPEANGVSVIICCYNSAARLPETLRHMAAQKVSGAYPWELLMIVDEATKDDTIKVIESFRSQFAPGQLRIVMEPKRGLGLARIKGAYEAKYEYMSFVDDDNWCPSDWVEITHRTFTRLPEATVFGGHGDAVFERSPAPGWFDRFAAAYAVGSQYPEAGEVTNKATSLLWGASLSMRRSSFRALLERGFEFACTEKLGPKLYPLIRARPCEDTELCYALRAVGARFFYVPELTYKHFMAADRLNWTSVRKMFRGQGRAGVFGRLFLAATRWQMTSEKAARERNWLFQVARALRRLAGIAVRHPIIMMSDAEGSAARLQADALIGELEMLFHMRGVCAKYFDLYEARYYLKSETPGLPANDNHPARATK